MWTDGTTWPQLCEFNSRCLPSAKTKEKKKWCQQDFQWRCLRIYIDNKIAITAGFFSESKSNTNFCSPPRRNTEFSVISQICFLNPARHERTLRRSWLRARAYQPQIIKTDLLCDSGWRYTFHFPTKREVLSSCEVEHGFQKDIESMKSNKAFHKEGTVLYLMQGDKHERLFDQAERCIAHFRFFPSKGSSSNRLLQQETDFGTEINRQGKDCNIKIPITLGQC